MRSRRTQAVLNFFYREQYPSRARPARIQRGISSAIILSLRRFAATFRFDDRQNYSSTYETSCPAPSYTYGIIILIAWLSRSTQDRDQRLSALSSDTQRAGMSASNLAAVFLSRLIVERRRRRTGCRHQACPKQSCPISCTFHICFLAPSISLAFVLTKVAIFVLFVFRSPFFVFRPCSSSSRLMFVLHAIEMCRLLYMIPI